jgi:hypothetical protein
MPRHRRYIYAAFLRQQFAVVFLNPNQQDRIKEWKKYFVTDAGCVLAYIDMLLARVFDPAADKVHIKVCDDNLKD